MQLKDAIKLIECDFLTRQSVPSVWADLGCGAGLFAQALDHYLYPGSKIFCVDKRAGSGFKISGSNAGFIFIKADFEKDNLPFKKLNGILMANSLHYVKDKFSFFKKCMKIFHNETFLIVEYDTDIPVFNWVPYPINFESLNKLSGSLSFHSVVRTGDHASLYGRGGIYAALIQ
ncbi:MAG: class I SAM-dependent methyltransferase [Chitinophagaceae bacterium]|nr:class I SAM-dependent methyltransferase [Chitinophagaceae bacterium]